MRDGREEGRERKEGGRGNEGWKGREREGRQVKGRKDGRK